MTGLLVHKVAKESKPFHEDAIKNEILSTKNNCVVPRLCLFLNYVFPFGYFIFPIRGTLC